MHISTSVLSICLGVFFAALSTLTIGVTALPVPVKQPITARSLYLNLPLRKRLLFFKRGLFNEAITLSDLGGARALGAAVANVVGGPSNVCDVAESLFVRIAEEETAGGVNTIGDRAIAGMKRMLGTLDTADTVAKVLADDLTPTQRRALRLLVAIPDKTIASLRAYKYLLDTQAALQETVALVQGTGGEAALSNEVLDVLVPIMKELEATIDKMGDDFSTNTFNIADQEKLIDIISTSSESVFGLQSLNRSLASGTTAKIEEVSVAFSQLDSSVRGAAAISDDNAVISESEFDRATAPPNCIV